MPRAWGLVLIAPFGVGVLLHCGGATRSDGTQDGGATSGVGAGGGTVTGSGTGSGGSTVADICRLPMVSGPCDAAIPAYWHDPSTGVCMPFTYGGCEGNANNFRSLEACQMACSAGQPGLDTCAGPDECGLVGAACCGICNPNSSHAFVAVNRTGAIEFNHLRGCDGIGCGPCPPVPDSELTVQYFIPTCENGRCGVLDIRQSDLTACAADTDCVMRHGAVCCEYCGNSGIVVINRNADLRKLVCPMPATDCPLDCVPNFPPGYTPFCNNGRCAISFPL
jgi:Kunitz/Bovine pancreatic trypsin inhibitor domain